MACSGATCADLTAPDDLFAALGEMEPPQIDAVTSATTVATLSIGGNDAGFDRVLRACVYRPEDPGNAGCGRPGSPARRLAEAGLRGLDATLAGAYVAVAARMAPGGRLLVVGYPRPFAEGEGIPPTPPSAARRLPARGHAAPDARPRDAGGRAAPERASPAT